MNDQLLWFVSRGSGVVSLILLTAVTALGLLSVGGWQRPGWPRFLTAELHGNLALMSVAFVAVHVTSVILDPFTALGVSAATIPFASSYRPIWVGLGVISVYLFLAMIVTSLLRDRIGIGAWRVIHFTAYAGWPLALAHGLGSGSDAFSVWLLPIEVACAAVVALALVWRLNARGTRVLLKVVVAATADAPAPYAERGR